jgi:hypothetical protein
MKLSSDDPRLSAYLFGELPAAEAAAVEHAVAADPALRLALDELTRVAALLEGSLSSAPAGLRPAQREAVLRAVRHAGQADQVVDFAPAAKGRGPWWMALGAAAALVLALVLASRVAGPGGRQGATAEGGVAEISLLPMPGSAGVGGSAPAGGAAAAVHPAAGELRNRPGVFLDRISRELARGPLPDPARLPALRPLPPLAAGGELALPVLVGQASYGWVRGWVRDRAELPPKDAVRLEELVNAFPLPLAESAGLASAIETAPCPWNPGSVLVAATLRAPAGGAMPVRWSFEPAAACRARLIAAPGVVAGPLPERLPGGRSVTVLLEVVPAPGAARLGVLKLDAGGDFSGRIVELPAAAVSPAMRQLGLVASFGLWLREEGVDRSAMVAILDAAGADEDPGRADSRRLLRQALDLAAAGR